VAMYWIDEVAGTPDLLVLRGGVKGEEHDEEELGSHQRMYRQETYRHFDLDVAGCGQGNGVEFVIGWFG
jgi:hypothetical protein